MERVGQLPAAPEAGSPGAQWRDWANALPNVAGMGIECLSVETDEAEFTYVPGDFPLNPGGSVNGGVVSAVVDQVLGVVASTMVETGYTVVTGSLHVQYHLPAIPPLSLRGVGLPGGRRVKYVEVEVTGSDGRRCATGLGTMIAARIR